MYVYIYKQGRTLLVPNAWRPHGQPGIMVAWLGINAHITRHGCLHCMEMDHHQVIIT